MRILMNFTSCCSLRVHSWSWRRPPNTLSVGCSWLSVRSVTLHHPLPTLSNGPSITCSFDCDSFLGWDPSFSLVWADLFLTPQRMMILICRLQPERRCRSDTYASNASLPLALGLYSHKLEQYAAVYEQLKVGINQTDGTRYLFLCKPPWWKYIPLVANYHGMKENTTS